MITKLIACDHLEMYRNTEFQRIARKGKKGFLSEQCKEIEENNRMGITLQEISARKLEIHQGSISCKDGHDKVQKW